MHDPLAALERACDGRVSPASEGDAFLGRLPQWVVHPATRAAVADTMRIATEHDLAVVARGAGTKLRWGNRPERLDVVLDTSGLDALTEHAAGDLILACGAGRRIDTIQRDVAATGQRLSVDPCRSGTIGGAVATASTGPMRLRYGAVRDLLIGITFVRADGVIAHSGGKVVKNVAGYDLGKLLGGSFGMLGVITDVVFRLHPEPQDRGWISTEIDSAQQADDVAQRLVHSQLMAVGLILRNLKQQYPAVRYIEVFN